MTSEALGPGSVVLVISRSIPMRCAVITWFLKLFNIDLICLSLLVNGVAAEQFLSLFLARACVYRNLRRKNVL